MKIKYGIIAVITLVSLVWFAGCSKESPESMPANSGGAENASVMVLDESNFSETIAEGVVLVDFWATWCGPCKLQAPIVEEVAGLFAGKVRVAKLDVDQGKSVAIEYGISAIPTLIIFKDGEPVKRFTGLTEADALRDAISEVL